MEHFPFLAINIGSEEIMISRARLDEMLINTNQSSTSLHIRGPDDQDFSFRSKKSCDKMSIDFEHNMHNSIRMNPSRTIKSIIVQITSLESGTEIGFGRNSDDQLPPRKIGRFNLFGKGISDFSNISALWNCKAKI